MIKFLKRIGIRVEELILILIIGLNVLDFFEILPGDLDYIKKIVSWSALGFLLYHASLTKLFFGQRHKHMDVLLILSYFVLIIKNFVAFSSVTIDDVSVTLSFFYRVIIQNAPLIEELSFYIGGTMLFVMALYAAFRCDIYTPSLMHVIHEEGPRPKTVGKFTVRFSIILLVFTFFFIAVFNLMMEWLAIAVDAPLLMLGLFFYLFKAKDFGTETVIYKLGNMGEGFYEKFINLFHSKSKIFLGISGMLVLHLVTDVGNFVIPHLVGIHDHLYFSKFGPGHEPLITLLRADYLMLSTPAEFISLIVVYSLNAIGILMLLLGPAYLWYSLFRDVPVSVPKWLLGFFASSVSAFLLSPIFKIGSLASSELMGVDITTQQVANNPFPVVTVAIISVAIGVFVYALAHQKFLKQLYVLASVIVSVSFFSMYIYFFSTDITIHYVNTINLLFANSKVFVAILLILFLVITVLFYAGGLLMYFYELVKN